MVRNEEIYKQAIIFRKRGFTYTEIAKICGVSKSTVSNWCKDKRFSKQVAKDNASKATKENKKRLALINKARATERAVRYNEAIRSAETEYKHYRTSPLFIAGLSIYLSAGDNTDKNIIRFSSANIELHIIFMHFCTEFLGIKKDQIKFWLLLYPDLDEKASVKHWSKHLKLSPANFYKNQVIQSRSQKHSLHFGVGNTIIGSTVLKKKLNKWIELVTKELKN